MCLLKEKRKLELTASRLQKRINWQLSDLTISIKIRSQADLIHPGLWGHHTKRWLKGQPTLRSGPATINSPDRVPTPPPLPSLQNDSYSNVSKIITCHTISDNQVGYDRLEYDAVQGYEAVEEHDAVQEYDAMQEYDAVQLHCEQESSSVLVHHEMHEETVPSSIMQGETRSPAWGIDCLMYGDDTTPIDSVYRQVMTPHPPPFLTLDEYDGAQECPETFIDHTEYDAEEVCDDEDILEQSEIYSATPEKSAYDDFAAFYANYEEGAEYLYYREYEQDAEDDYEADEEAFEEDEGTEE